MRSWSSGEQRRQRRQLALSAISALVEVRLVHCCPDDIVTGAHAALSLVSYGATMPHFNLNVDEVLAFFLDDDFLFTDLRDKPINCLEGRPSAGSGSL